ARSGPSGAEGGLFGLDERLGDDQLGVATAAVEAKAGEEQGGRPGDAEGDAGPHDDRGQQGAEGGDAEGEAAEDEAAEGEVAAPGASVEVDLDEGAALAVAFGADLVHDAGAVIDDVGAAGALAVAGVADLAGEGATDDVEGVVGRQVEP